MVDIEKLTQKITDSGFKKKYIAEQLELSAQGFANKMNKKSDFSSEEIKVLSQLLSLTAEQTVEIFLN